MSDRQLPHEISPDDVRVGQTIQTTCIWADGYPAATTSAKFVVGELRDGAVFDGGFGWFCLTVPSARETGPDGWRPGLVAVVVILHADVPPEPEHKVGAWHLVHLRDPVNTRMLWRNETDWSLYPGGPAAFGDGARGVTAAEPVYVVDPAKLDAMAQAAHNALGLPHWGAASELIRARWYDTIRAAIKAGEVT